MIEINELWRAALAILGGAPTMIAGVVMAYAGFSGAAMAINMPANLLLLLWVLILDRCLPSRSTRASPRSWQPNE